MFHSTSSSVKLFITLSTKFFARGSKGGGLPVKIANISSSSSSDDEEESSNSLISLLATNKAAVVSIFASSQKPPSARRKQKEITYTTHNCQMLYQLFLVMPYVLLGTGVTFFQKRTRWLNQIKMIAQRIAEKK